MGIHFSQTSVIYFCRGFSCCPYYRGVRNSEVSARRELAELEVRIGLWHVVHPTKLHVLKTSRSTLFPCLVPMDNRSFSRSSTASSENLGTRLPCPPLPPSIPRWRLSKQTGSFAHKKPALATISLLLA